MASNVELIWTLTRLQEAIDITIGLVFILDFGIKFLLLSNSLTRWSDDRDGIGLLSEDTPRAGALFFAGVVCDRGMWLFDGNPGNIFSESGSERSSRTSRREITSSSASRNY